MYPKEITAKNKKDIYKKEVFIMLTIISGGIYNAHEKQ